MIFKTILTGRVDTSLIKSHPKNTSIKVWYTGKTVEGAKFTFSLGLVQHCYTYQFWGYLPACAQAGRSDKKRKGYGLGSSHNAPLHPWIEWSKSGTL